MKRKLKQQVADILRVNPKSRDDDQYLTLLVWYNYYHNYIHEAENAKDGDPKRYVFMADIMHLPREDHVKRIRANFQNTLGLYPPTNIEVVKKRRQNVERWRQAMSNENTRL